jgi:superoxide dismutase, Cu-Zn family
MQRVLPVVTLLAVTVVALSGCLGGASEASASLHRVTPHGEGIGQSVYGYANFTQRGNEITIRVEVWGLDALAGFEPGPKGTHVHAGNDCSPSWDGTSVTPGGGAGGHFNPDNVSHPEHAGALGNMDVDENGNGVFEITVSTMDLGRSDSRNILGRTVVIHAGEDDRESQPAGDSGPRLLCGMIRAL